MRLVAIIAACMIAIRSSTLANPPYPPELQCEFESYVSATAAEGSSHFVVETHNEPGIDSVRFSQIKPRYAWAEGTNVNTNVNLFWVGEQSWMFAEEFPLADNTYLT